MMSLNNSFAGPAFYLLAAMSLYRVLRAGKTTSMDSLLEQIEGYLPPTVLEARLFAPLYQPIKLTAPFHGAARGRNASTKHWVHLIDPGIF